MAADTPTAPLGRRAVAGWLAVGIVAVSTSAVLARLAMGPEPALVTGAPGHASALAIAWWRTTLGAVALAPVAWREQRRRTRSGTRLGRRRQAHLAATGLALGLHFALFQGSLALTSVASAVTLTTMSPLFVALGGWWLLGERSSRRTWLGIAVTVSGAAVIGAGDAAGHGARALTGDAMALGAALAASGYLLAGRHARRTVPTATYAATVYGWAALALLPVVLAAGVPLTGFSPATWAALAGIVVGPQLLGHTVFNLLLSTLPATTVAIAILAEPVGAGLLAWLLLGEVPAPLFAVGAPLVLLGVASVVTRVHDEPGPPSDAPRFRTPAAG